MRDEAARPRPEVRRHPHYEVGAQVGKQLRYGCRRWDSNPHEVALTEFFESTLFEDKR